MRTTIILAITLALTGYCYERAKGDIERLEETIEWQERAHAPASQICDKLAAATSWNAREMSEQLSKKRYEPIYRGVQQLNQLLVEMDKAIDLHKKVAGQKESRKKQQYGTDKALIHRFYETNVQAEMIIRNSLYSAGPIFGFEDEILPALLENTSADLKKNTDELQLLIVNYPSQTRNESRMRALHLKNKSILVSATRSLLEMTFTRMINCFPQYLKAYPIRSGRKAGDPIDLIFVFDAGTVEDSYDWIKLTINGKRYYLDGYGVVRYVGHRSADGILELTYRYSNPITGEEYEGALYHDLDEYERALREAGGYETIYRENESS